MKRTTTRQRRKEPKEITRLSIVSSLSTHTLYICIYLYIYTFILLDSCRCCSSSSSSPFLNDRAAESLLEEEEEATEELEEEDLPP